MGILSASSYNTSVRAAYGLLGESIDVAMNRVLMTNVLPCIPSTRRPDNVQMMIDQYPDWIWVVKDKKDEKDYLKAGANHVEIQRGEMLHGARTTCNAIARSAGLLSLQVDDDVRGTYRVYSKSREDMVRIPIADAVYEVVQAMQLTDAHMGSPLSTANPYFSNQRIHVWAFVVRNS